MAPKSNLSIRERIELVKAFIGHFTTTTMPVSGDDVWRAMSKHVEGKWSARNVYTNVREDRQDIVTIARAEMGVAVLEDHEVQTHQNQRNNSESRSKVSRVSSDSDDSTWVGDENRKQYETETTDLKLVLTEEEWNLIKPDDTVVYGKRKTVILKPQVWTNVIDIAFSKQYKTRCAFVYKRANVKKGPDSGSYIIDLYGCCKSTPCGNKIRGHGEKLAAIDGVIICINTRDTQFEIHEDVKRPLNGKRRKQAAQEMSREGCTVWKRRQARLNMKDGDLEPTFFPNADVLRQAKMEGIHANLNVESGDSRNLMQLIEELLNRPDYRGLVQNVSAKPFFVDFSTPAQLYAYKKYLRVNWKRSVIIVDATGSLVRKLKRPDDDKTRHIFLYSVVVNFQGMTQPVHQMISEAHDTVTIKAWLEKWIYKTKRVPTEVVCDYSRALINALCGAFNARDIKAYMDTCFAIIENKRGVIVRPKTIIRIDVAHLIHMVCRWPCFSKTSQLCIKEFFVHCIALMVESTTLDEFARVFKLTSAVGLQTHEDSTFAFDSSLVYSVKDARHELEDFISTRNIEVKLREHTPRDESDYTAGPFEFDVTNDDNISDDDISDDEDICKLDDDTKSRNRLINWVTLQKDQVKETVTKGRDPNAFFLPDFIQRLHKLANEFPLWTGVAVPSGSPHATSSYIEAFHQDVKRRVFKDIQLPARADIFLKHLVGNIVGETRLFTSMLKKSHQQAKFERMQKVEEQQIDIAAEESCLLGENSFTVDIALSTNAIDPDFMAHENWRRKAPPEKDVDDFSDINVQVDHFQTPVELKDLPILSSSPIATGLNDHISLDHSYTQPETTLKPIKITEVVDTNDYCREETSVHDDNFDLNEKPLLEEKEIQGDESKRPEGAKKSKFFREYPEIRQINQQTTKRFKPHLLPNGNDCVNGVSINGEIVFVRNTCAFDSLVSILLTRAIDDGDYSSFIEKSQNITLQFVSAFMKAAGVTSEILQERVKILQNFHPKKLHKNLGVLTYATDAEGSICNIVRQTMKSEPSIDRIETCSHCKGRTYTDTTISPNHNVIINKGFKQLLSALAFKPIFKLQCQTVGCPGEFTLYTKPRTHIFVDLDIRTMTENVRRKTKILSERGLQCALYDMPTTIDIRVVDGRNSNIIVKYSLAGIVGFQPGHFIAYCRRFSGKWEVYNDCHQEIAGAKEKIIIEPHLAVYVICQQQKK